MQHSIIYEYLLIREKEIKKILDLLSSLFPIRTAYIYMIESEGDYRHIYGNNGEYAPFCECIRREFKERCSRCDTEKLKEAEKIRKPLLYQCYNGLYEMYLPLFIENFNVGFLHFGQVRSEESFQKIALACGLKKHTKYHELKTIYESMPAIPCRQMNLIAELFFMLAENIIKKNLIELKNADPLYFLKKYINENTKTGITIEAAAQYIGKSKSWLTHSFQKLFNCSFHEFVKKNRIEQAKNLLKTRSISETADLCGFSNRYHFSRIFKKTTGLSPGVYAGEYAGKNMEGEKIIFQEK